MVKRKIITIDEKVCNGCGKCIPNCPEGAIQIIDGKARLISDIFCDGLGACLGHCPKDAITIEEREAETYDERKVMENVVKHGKNTILAHLNHLKDHGEIKYLHEALDFLKEKQIDVDFQLGSKNNECQVTGCPGSQTVEFEKKHSDISHEPVSQLQQWPIQMHLISPDAPYFHQSDLIVSADCVAYSYGNFHNRLLKGKRLTIACPKLDSNKEIYTQKLISLIDTAKINTLTVVTMQVPCCQGLLLLAKNAVEHAKRKIPIKHIMVSIKGDIVKNEWI